MFPDLVPIETSAGTAVPVRRATTPALFSPTERAERRFREFFTAHIRNPNTRLAYLAAVRRFATWCERRGLALDEVEPMVVAAYIEQLTGALAPASVKQHLAALRMLFRLARRRTWGWTRHQCGFSTRGGARRRRATCGRWRVMSGRGAGRTHRGWSMRMRPAAAANMVRKLPEGFSGTAQVDGYSGYNRLRRSDRPRVGR